MTLHLHAVPDTPRFIEGQVWEPRKPAARIFGDDHWTIVTTKGNAKGRVIAQDECGSVREFCLQGHFSCDGDEHNEECDLDLATLVAAQKRSVA